MFTILVKKSGPAQFADAFSDEFWARYIGHEDNGRVPAHLKLTRRDPLMIRLAAELRSDATRNNAILGTVAIADRYAEDYRVVNEPSINSDRVEVLLDGEWVFYSH